MPTSTDRPMRRADDAGEGIAARLTVAALARTDLGTVADAQARIDEILTMAAEWDAGRLPLAEVRRLCTGAERFLAVRFGPRPTPPALLRLLDALVAGEGVHITPHGVVTEDELREGEGAVIREDGRVGLAWPIRRPWRVKPDPARGIEGERAPAVFRRREDRGPAVRSFTVAPPVEAHEVDEEEENRWR